MAEVTALTLLEAEAMVIRVMRKLSTTPLDPELVRMVAEVLVDITARQAEEINKRDNG
jgi:hypothetical protein